MSVQQNSDKSTSRIARVNTNFPDVEVNGRAVGALSKNKAAALAQRGMRVVEKLVSSFCPVNEANYSFEAAISPILLTVYSDQELQQIETILQNFVTEYEDELRHLYRQYSKDDRCDPIVLEPASILIYERLKLHSHAFEAAWLEHYSQRQLDALASFWSD